MAFRKFVYIVYLITVSVARLAGKNERKSLDYEKQLPLLDYEKQLQLLDYEKQLQDDQMQNETRKNGLTLFCRTMTVAEVNCTCLKFPDFCDFVSFKEDAYNITVNTEYRCDAMYNTVRAGFNVFGATLGIIGNGAVLVVTVTNWEQGTRYNQLIIGLAVTDFLFSLNQMIISVPLFWTCKWVYANVMCRILTASVDISVSIAMGFILIIALERYAGILYPFSNGLTQTKFWIVVSMNLVFGVISIIPMLMYLKVGNFGVCHESWPKPNHSLIYSWTMLLTYFAFPVLLTLVMYYRIIRKLHTTRLMFGKQNSALGEHSTSRRIRDNRRIMAILISVLVLFIILVLPNKLVWILLDYLGVDNISKSIYRMMNLVGLIPYSFHVAANPIIYSFVDSKFRTKVMNLVFMRHKRSVSIVTSGRTRAETNIVSSRRL